jgi:hypothetical protein
MVYCGAASKSTVLIYEAQGSVCASIASGERSIVGLKRIVVSTVVIGRNEAVSVFKKRSRFSKVKLMSARKLT